MYVYYASIHYVVEPNKITDTAAIPYDKKNS